MKDLFFLIIISKYRCEAHQYSDVTIMVILLRIKKKSDIRRDIFSGTLFLRKKLLQALMLRPVSTAYTRFQDVLLRLPVKEDQKA